MLWLLLVSSLFAGCIDGEIISVRDATPEKGLPQTLTFYVKRRQHNVKLFLQENNRKRQSTAVRSKQRLVSKSYQDFLHGGSFEVSLTKQNTGRYVRTLTGNFKLNGDVVQIKPTMVSRTQRTRANAWTPYILLTNEKMRMRNVPGSNSVDNLLAQRAEKMRARKPVRQFSYETTSFLPPTVESFTTEEKSDLSEMTSPWSTDATFSSDITDITSQSPYSSEWTTSVYSTENPRRCKDGLSDCGKWLNDYYQNNLQNFCGRDMLDSLCCETCSNWEASPVQCKDDFSDCRKMLQDVYHNDFDAFCPIWDESCCATCSRKPEGNCVDKGSLGLTCQELLDWAVHGNMVEMCKHYDKECCAMCSQNGSPDV